jgi:hypothetical protein
MQARNIYFLSLHRFAGDWFAAMPANTVRLLKFAKLAVPGCCATVCAGLEQCAMPAAVSCGEGVMDIARHARREQANGRDVRKRANGAEA